jgi:hypothetical protein
MEERLDPPYLSKADQRGDFQVWIVDAAYICGHISQAHAESSRMEFRCTHHPDELHDALAAEGWA